MALRNIPLPFTLSNVYGGLGKVKGLIQVEKDQLNINFQSEDNVLGLVKSRPQYIDISFKDIESVQLKSNLISTRCILRVYNLAAIDAFPKPTGNVPAGELRLSLKRADRERAEQLISFINLRLSEIRLDSLDNDELY